MDLESAVEQYAPDIVQSLLDVGANPNQQNSIGETPLMVLLHEGFREEDVGITNNANNANNTNNANPLIAESRFEKIFRILLPVTDLNIQNNAGETALMIAVGAKDSKQEVQQLLEAGARIDQITKDGDTVFHILSGLPDADATKLGILQLLAIQSTPELINRLNATGYSALDNALVYGNYKIAEHLLYKGATLTQNAIDIIQESDSGPLLEIAEHIFNSKDVLPPMNISRDLEVLFGVELEICVKLTPECAQEKSGKRMNPTIFQSKSWSDLFALFAKFILKKSALAAKMRDRYEYMYVSGGAKYGANYILNLTTFQLEPMPAEKAVAYDKPFFTIDRSVVCADYQVKPGQENRRVQYMPDIEETFHIELVSPILTKLEDLKDLLVFLGMQNPSCFIANDSAGFHVNVSLMNRTTQKPIPLTSDFFTRTFFPAYSVWEAEMYPKVRGAPTDYAQCIGDIEAERFPELYHEICKSKYVTLHRKAPRELVEFRLFGSSANMNDLLLYTEMATNFLRDCYVDWYSFYIPNPQQIRHQLTSKEGELRKSLQSVQSRLRTRKTPGLLRQRQQLQNQLLRLKSVRGKNVRTQRNILKALR